MSTPEQILDSLKTELGQFIGRADENMRAMNRRIDAVEVRMAKPSTGGPGGYTGKSVADEIFESQGWKSFAETGRGRVAFKIDNFTTKTAITNTGVGYATTGVVPYARVDGIIPVPMRTWRVRELLRTLPASGAGGVDFVKVTVGPIASPQVEALDKSEASMTMAASSEKFRTLATWIPASRQVVSDLAGLRETIDVHLMDAVRNLEDTELLSGDNTGEHLNGLTTQATAFNASLLSASAGWTRIDIIARAIQQAATAGYTVDGIVLAPADWWAICLTKDSTGQYILGNPGQMTETRLWGIPVSVTTAMTAGTFVLGNFSTGAAIHQALDAVIEVSDSHSDYFIKNLLAIRCEERLALAVYKPGAFIYGAFSSSPA